MRQQQPGKTEPHLEKKKEGKDKKERMARKGLGCGGGVELMRKLCLGRAQGLASGPPQLEKAARPERASDGRPSDLAPQQAPRGLSGWWKYWLSSLSLLQYPAGCSLKS